jgi:hypothetical protein
MPGIRRRALGTAFKTLPVRTPCPDLPKRLPKTTHQQNVRAWRPREPATSGGFLNGSDGTRTRDLRRDRPEVLCGLRDSSRPPKVTACRAYLTGRPVRNQRGSCPIHVSRTANVFVPNFVPE